MEFVDAWEALDSPWQQCFRLAWESFRAGSVPVGAVLVDATGAVVASGRNLRNEIAPAGWIGGSNLAHAEVNALVGLAPGDYTDHTLYSTLEPCLLCHAAVRYSHVGTIRYAAADPMWTGIDRVTEVNEELARRWPRCEGPLGGGWATVSTVLHLLVMLERGPAAVAAVNAHRSAAPELFGLAQGWAGQRTGQLRSMTLPDALEQLWPELSTVDI